jgi:hypothetical protein
VKDYLSPDWTQEKPDEAAARNAVASLRVVSLHETLPALDAYIVALKTCLRNGGVQFGRFRISFEPVIHWYGSRNRFEEVNLIEQLLSLSAVREALPTMQIPVEFSKPLKLTWTTPFTLDGELAACLYGGGAYDRFTGTAAEAKALGVAAAADLVQTRLNEVQIYTAEDSWTPWFKDVAWDCTWFGFDKRDGTFWLLAVTDED